MTFVDFLLCVLSGVLGEVLPLFGAIWGWVGTPFSKKLSNRQINYYIDLNKRGSEPEPLLPI